MTALFVAGSVSQAPCSKPGIALSVVVHSRQEIANGRFGLFFGHELLSFEHLRHVRDGSLAVNLMT